MTAMDINKILNPINVNTLLKETSVILVYDTETHMSFETNVKMLAKAIAEQLIKDGVLPMQGD